VPRRADDLSTATRLSVVSIVWSSLVGAVAVFAALQSGALSLLGFGVNALIDASASAALVWRFAVEVRAPRRAERVERAAERVVGAALSALGIYLIAGSVQALAAGVHPEGSDLGLALLCASLVVQPPLALLKRRVAIRLRSGALRADSFLTAIGALLALLSLIGLAATAQFGVGWADAVAALAVGLIVLREGATSLGLSRQSLRRR
jgi:divalent metal cation (Fe/Co/Zn/Cd) transporter